MAMATVQGHSPDAFRQMVIFRENAYSFYMLHGSGPNAIRAMWALYRTSMCDSPCL
jgi:hypothetical protein